MPVETFPAQKTTGCDDEINPAKGSKRACNNETGGAVNILPRAALPCPLADPSCTVGFTDAQGDDVRPLICIRTGAGSTLETKLADAETGPMPVETFPAQKTT
ncbi:hypothetical protein MRX96_007716 [Rhipicephalus microplus]